MPQGIGTRGKSSLLQQKCRQQIKGVDLASFKRLADLGLDLGRPKSIPHEDDAIAHSISIHNKTLFSIKYLFYHIWLLLRMGILFPPPK